MTRAQLIELLDKAGVRPGDTIRISVRGDATTTYVRDITSVYVARTLDDIGPVWSLA